MLSIIILAVIQGITEFLPISSSAHLIIFRELFNIFTYNSNLNLLIDLSLHFGTLLSIIVYFYADIWKIIKDILHLQSRLALNIIISSIPAAIAGILLSDYIENSIRNNLVLISISLIIVGIIIYTCDKKSESKYSLNTISNKNAFIIGLVQALALIPGFSRSGVTISAARLLKLDKDSSAKYSFYLSIPVILGAFLLNIIKDNSINLIINNIPIFITGIVVSFMSGILCISFLLNYIKKHDMKIFMYYRIILGISTLLFIYFR